MAIARNLEEYRKIQQVRINKLKKGVRRGPITSAKYMAAQLRRLAPRVSGRVINSVHRRKSTVSVGGTSNSGFPYIHWINATPGVGVERVNLIPRFRPAGMKRSKRALSYAEVARTGQPGFFWVAQDLTRVFNTKLMLRNTRNALIATS